MKKGTVEKFGLEAIADAVKGSDLATARAGLSEVVGAAVEVSGKVLKVVKREGECKLVIEPEDESGFVVFADCPGELERVRKGKIRKGSPVRVKGKFQSFGWAAICLSDCRLQTNSDKTDKTDTPTRAGFPTGKHQKTSDLRGDTLPVANCQKRDSKVEENRLCRDRKQGGAQQERPTR